MKRKRIYITAAAICVCLTGVPAASAYAQGISSDKATETTEDAGQIVDTVSAEQIEEYEQEDVSESYETADTEDAYVIEAEESKGMYKIEYFLELVKNITDKNSLKDNSYSQITVKDADDLQPGDILYDENDTMYVFTAGDVNPDIAWYVYNNGKLEEMRDDVLFDTGSEVYRHTPETPLVVKLDTLKAVYGSSLYDISLPEGYEWNCADKTLNKIGTMIFDVVYTPENTLKYTQAYTTVEVEVEKIKKNISAMPEDSYELSYYPNNKLSSISLPDGWEWDKPESKLDVGTKKYKAVYNGSEVYDYIESTEKIIAVKVNKSVFDVSGVAITVTEGTKLTNSLLPGINEGKLSWTEKNITATKSFTTTCKFTPYDKKHYNSLSDIDVVINVVPKAEVKKHENNTTEQTTTEDGTTETPSKQDSDGEKKTDNKKSNPFNVVSSKSSDKSNSKVTSTVDNNTAQTDYAGTPTTVSSVNSSQVASTDNQVNKRIDNQVTGQQETQTTEQQVQSPRITLPTINLTGSGKKNTKTTKKADAAENKTQKVKLPSVDLSNPQTTEDRSPATTEAKIESSEVVGDILEDQKKEAEKTSSENASTEGTSESSESTESVNKENSSEKKKKSPLGIIALLGIAGGGGYLGYQKIKARNVRR